MKDLQQSTIAKNQPNYLMWFRRDLRIHDNTALSAICEQANNDNASVTALFIITPQQWLAHNQSITLVDHLLRTLPILATALSKQLNITLHVMVADTFAQSIDTINTFCQDNHMSKIFTNKEYELNEINRDTTIEKKLLAQQIGFQSYDDQCILPPLTITTKELKMYQVFTPFYKNWQKKLDNQPITLHSIQQSPALPLTNSHLTKPSLTREWEKSHLLTEVFSEYCQQWQNKMGADTFPDEVVDQLLTQSRKDFVAGETQAQHQLDQFIADAINNYDIARDQPALQATSYLSAYLAIGSISPRLCYIQANKALKMADSQTKTKSADINRWISELAWRDFYRHVLVSRPDLIKHQAYHVATDTKVNWSYQQKDFDTWCTGQTGVPLVDSAMRCLNTTGFMHNRLRMVTAMFLTKDLLIDWRWGERYFMQLLIDGDFASNNGGWQWSASTGTDAAPYFRIMNPFSQGKTHDKEATFIKQWLPELKHVPTTVLHDENKLRDYLKARPTIKYPQPMVEHKKARLIAIAEFKAE